MNDRPGLLAATMAALAVLIGLGVWQLERLEEKRSLIARTNARLSATAMPFDEAAMRERSGEKMEYQPVFLDGVFAHDLEAHVFGTYDGAAGVYVFTPLDAADPATGGRRFVYVNRGFVPQKFRDPATRPEGLVDGDVRVVGLLRREEHKRGPEKWLKPDDQPEDNLYFEREPKILAARHGIDAPSLYIDSFGRENDGAWPKGGVTRVEFPNRHLEYALTWFGLAAALLGVFFAFSKKRG